MVFKTCAIKAPAPGVAPSSADWLVTVQVYVVPATSLVKAIEVVPPEHIVEWTGVTVRKGIGLTATLTIMVVPSHPFA